MSNSVINLGIRDQYADALSQLGFEFEVLAEQVSGDTFSFLLKVLLLFNKFNAVNLEIGVL